MLRTVVDKIQQKREEITHIGMLMGSIAGAIYLLGPLANDSPDDDPSRNEQNASIVTLAICTVLVAIDLYKFSSGTSNPHLGHAQAAFKNCLATGASAMAISALLGNTLVAITATTCAFIPATGFGVLTLANLYGVFNPENPANPEPENPIVNSTSNGNAPANSIDDTDSGTGITDSDNADAYQDAISEHIHPPDEGINQQQNAPGTDEEEITQLLPVTQHSLNL